jgi:hypothetical protein
MDGVDGEERFVKVWVLKGPYQKLGSTITMVSYEV